MRQTLCRLLGDHLVVSVFSLSIVLLPAGCFEGQGEAGNGPNPAADLSTMEQLDGGMGTSDLAPPADMALPPAEGKPLWGRYYEANAKAVAIGPDGAIYLTGVFSSSDFGDGPISANGDSDGFLIKFDKFGQRLWARTFGRAYVDVADKLAVDSAGNTVVVGYSLRTASTGTHDAFVTYYTSDGTQRYFRVYGGPSTTAVDGARAVAFAADGSFYVTGGFEDRINFGGGELLSAGDRDIYLLQLRADGMHVFSKRWGFTGYDQSASLSILPDGDVLMTGRGGYPIDFGNGDVGTNPNAEVFLVRFSPQGAARWSKRFRIAASSSVYTVAGKDGTLWLVGDTNIAPDFGGGPLVSSTGRGLFSAHLSGTGAYLSASIVPTSGGGAYATSVEIDSHGQLIIGGEASGDVDFGFGPTTTADGRAYFMKQAPTGQARWAHRFGGNFSDIVNGVAVGPSDEVVAAGYLSQNTSIGSVSLARGAFVLNVTP